MLRGAGEKRTLVTTLTIATVFGAAAACTDLALEPDQHPTALSLLPVDTTLLEGQTALLRFVVTDQNQQPLTPLPTWALPDWSLSDPNILKVSRDGTMEALGGGEVRVSGEVAGLEAETRVRVIPLDVQLSVPVIQLVQSVQTLDGNVPIIAGKDALLRVFMTGDQMSFFEPTVRVAFYLGDEIVHSAQMPSPLYFLPSTVDESKLNRSYNTIVPADVMKPGLELVIELDPEQVVPLAPGSSVRVPETGRMALNIRGLEPFRLRVIPVLAPRSPYPAASGEVFDWTDNLSEDSDQVQYTRFVFPISDFEVDVREMYVTHVDLTTTTGWSSFLREIDLLRRTDPDGAGRYYYGAVTPPRGSARGGLGYIGKTTSVGRASEFTLAHELGHNMGLRHAPCGSVSSPDQSYPYEDGSIGKWGYDLRANFGAGELRDPAFTKDLMSYCNPEWISDYHYRKSFAFRTAQGSAAQRSDRLQHTGEVLILWGGSDGTVLTLEPAISMNAPVALPERGGPYRIEGFDISGGTVFSFDFSLTETEDIDGGHFSFALPLDAGVADELDRIQLLGPEGQMEFGEGVSNPGLAVITDKQTGRIRSILRNWDEADLISSEVDILITDGVRTHRVIGAM
mgnify:CR=1 FL=1